MERIEINVITGEKTVIQLTESEIAQLKNAETEKLANITYDVKRALEYPSFADQFDKIFHEGLDAWKAQIQAVKDKYPKGNA